VGIHGVTVTIAVLSAIAAVVSLVMALRSRLPIVRAVVRESLPILLAAGAIDIIVGLALDGQYEGGPFQLYPALLVLIPPFLEDTGALGGVLSARLASKLHLGIIEPTARPQRAAQVDFALIFMLAVPVFTLVAVSSEAASLLFGRGTPGVMNMIGVALIGGLLATLAGMAVAYYGTVATYRLGLDPDNYGIPLLTASMDLIGAFSLVGAVALLRIA
jgi:mgtE-like transporter